MCTHSRRSSVATNTRAPRPTHNFTKCPLPRLPLTPGCRWYALRSLSSVSLSAALCRRMAAGEQYATARPPARGKRVERGEAISIRDSAKWGMAEWGLWMWKDRARGKKKTPPGNFLGPRGVSWGLATDQDPHTQHTATAPLSLSTVEQAVVKLRECGDGCNLYRYGAKVFTPTRCIYVCIFIYVYVCI